MTELSAYLTAVELGLIYAIVAMGVYFTLKISNFPDLTVDGSFSLGGGIVALMISQGHHFISANLVAVAAGALAGLATGLIYVRLKVMDLLAGILVMTALYSVTLRIMKAPNITLFDQANLLSQTHPVLTLTLIVALVLGLAWWFLSTEYGLGLRVLGQNKALASAYGVNVNAAIIVSLMLSNGMIAFAGGLFVQSQGFSDISMGVGTIVLGLASVIIGENLRRDKRVFVQLLACCLGAILYRFAITVAMHSTGDYLKSSDLNLITVLIIVAVIYYSKHKSKGSSAP